MTQQLAPFADVEALINQGVAQMLSNATATWNGGAPFGVMLGREADTGFMPEVVTADRYAVSMCVANAPGIAEGSTGLCVNGRPVRVSGAVIPDASGWATFPIVFEGATDAGA